MRLVNYTQMLVVMTYNIWIILTLIATQVGFNAVFKQVVKNQKLVSIN